MTDQEKDTASVGSESDTELLREAGRLFDEGHASSEVEKNLALHSNISRMKAREIIIKYHNKNPPDRNSDAKRKHRARVVNRERAKAWRTVKAAVGELGLVSGTLSFFDAKRGKGLIDFGAPALSTMFDRSNLSASTDASDLVEGVLLLAILELDADDRPILNSIQIFDREEKYVTIGNRIIKTDVERHTASKYLKDEKFRAAAEAKAVGAMFANARGETSQRATAKASGIDPKNLRQIESGDTDPSLRTMRKIAESIGYDVEISLVPKDKG
ncbi:helix-turn-helix transcriptional regulator [Vannielia sp.]|uniref:helix-turn-helix domain-containing protein n=1 Tax=Vannielia sp. TaxID=2813045 RepID=UPI002614326D|nr:helix-turn-helix transcriptional regulator [Vannielia sp.]MDF1871982.1 helix-turn-helix transcriptional regulator [Vannielia sp.]